MAIKHVVLLLSVVGSCLAQTQEDFDNLKNFMNILARQVMRQQDDSEQIVRSYGQSGVEHVRLMTQGTRSYHSSSHNGPIGAATAHDHADDIRTLGSAEFSAVLNGVKFRTRHNDYALVRPTNTTAYHAFEDIEFPDVPPEILQKTSVEEQLDEMVEWFRAWQNQDKSVRDYRPYFKPVLCYLEGAWMNDTTFEESFYSSRHWLDANSFDELHEKEKYAVATGRKDGAENFAYLPQKMVGLDNNGLPIIAQWNYRIMCHPLKKDLPLNRLRLVDDLAVRFHMKYDKSQIEASRYGRYSINPLDSDTWVDMESNYQYIDDLMAEIPGKDNYNAYIADMAYGKQAFPYPEPPSGGEDQELNAAYYHRWVREIKKGNANYQHHGFNDENLWIAHTTQKRVASVKAGWYCDPSVTQDCVVPEVRLSYAIPLDIIYLTPLHKWNPYDVVYRGKDGSEEAAQVEQDGRNGGMTLETAYDGIKSNRYFLTPSEFFEGPELNIVGADSKVSENVGVLSNDGTKVHSMRASGLRTHTPVIKGLGSVRTRYEIFPVHGEGNNVWKEMDALKDFILYPDSHPYVSGCEAIDGVCVQVNSGILSIPFNHMILVWFSLVAILLK